MFERDYRRAIDGILRVAAARQRPVTEIAAELAQRHMAGRSSHRPRSLPRRVYERFLQRRMPRWYRARGARASFVARMASLQAEIDAMERGA
jgi:hypothetical protein